MSNLQAFFAQNVEKPDIVERVVSERFKDENGNPIKWKIGAVTSDKDAAIRKECTRKVPMPGQRGVYMPETDIDLYTTKLIVESVIFPDLRNAELQDSYGVKGAEALLRKMLLPGEFIELSKVVQEVNGYDKSMDELVEEAKN